MKEVIYRFDRRGTYVTEDETSFAKETQIRLVAEPHAFSLAIGNEVLRSTSFDGCVATVSCDGAVVFFDMDENELGRADGCDRAFAQARLEWKTGFLSVLLGCVETVDYYPNCDGESDRWGTEWVTQRKVTLALADYSVCVE